MSNMVVRTNVFSLNAHRNMKNIGFEQNRASNRLASGYRINSAADDAAGLAISESMRAQIRGLDQASRNSQDGQALIQTAEGGMQEIQNMVQRIRELMVQAANDTNNEDNRQSHIQLEVRQLLTEIDAMADRVEFNGMNLLNGQLDGAYAANSLIGGNIGIARGVMSVHRNTGVLGVGAGTAFVSVDAAMINTLYIDMGLTAPGATQAAAGTARQAVVANAIGMNVADLEWLVTTNEITTDNAERLFNLAGRLFNATAGQVRFQIGANADQLLSTGIADMRVTQGNLGSSLGSSLGDFVTTWEANLAAGAEAISSSLNDLDEALEFVNVARAELGAISNRLDYTMRSLDLSSENLQDAESRVRNADMAREMMRFTMSNVLQQASVSMLSQANQMPNNLLQLLR